MTKVEALEKQVKALDSKELAEFRRWFDEFDARAWDVQIERDVQSGKLDKLAEEALSEFRQGASREL